MPCQKRKDINSSQKKDKGEGKKKELITRQEGREYMNLGDTTVLRASANKASLILLIRPREMEIYPQKMQTIMSGKTFCIVFKS